MAEYHSFNWRLNSVQSERIDRLIECGLYTTQSDFFHCAVRHHLMSFRIAVSLGFEEAANWLQASSVLGVVSSSSPGDLVMNIRIPLGLWNNITECCRVAGIHVRLFVRAAIASLILVCEDILSVSLPEPAMFDEVVGRLVNRRCLPTVNAFSKRVAGTVSIADLERIRTELDLLTSSNKYYLRSPLT